jgi:hypothetical protein
MSFTSASEILQRVMSTVLGGLEGVKWVHDDIIVYAKDIEERNRQLSTCLNRLREYGITLNAAKCRFAASEAKFLAMQLSAKGIHATEEKVAAVQAFAPPRSGSEVRSFLGLVTFVSRFIPSPGRHGKATERPHKEVCPVEMGQRKWKDKGLPSNQTGSAIIRVARIL